MSISFSEVRTTTYLLYESKNNESKSVRMIDKEGPLYLPMLPVVPIPRKIYENHLEVTGTFMKDKENKYFIEVESIKEMP